MIGLVVIALSAYTLGALILRVLRLRPCSFGDRMLHALCLGLGAWCYVLYVMGSLFLFYRWLLIPLSCAAAITSPLLWRRDFSHAQVRLPKQLSPAAIILLSAAGIILILMLVTSLAPVTGGIRNDEICTHLSMPKEWMRHRGLAILPFSISYQAGNAHLLFLLASCFSAQSGPRLISWLSFALCLLAVYRIARQFSSRKTAALALVMAATNPLIFRSANVAFVDIESTLFALTPLCALAAFVRDRRMAWLGLCGLYLGIGCGIKPTNIIYAGATILVGFAWLIGSRQRPAAIAREVLTLISALIIFGAPWPIRNLVLTGSPTFPPPMALYRFGALKPLRGGAPPYSYQEVKEYYAYCLSRYGEYQRTWANFLKLAWDVTMQPARFQIGDSVGTLALSFLPLIFLFAPLPGAVWALLLFAVTSCGGLYFGVLPEARYFMAALMALSPVIAYCAMRCRELPVARLAARAVIGVNILFSLGVAGRISARSVLAVVHPRVREEYRRAGIPFYETFQYIRNAQIPLVRVCYPSQIFYYLSARYVVDPQLAFMDAAAADSIYVLDIDYSQTLERDLPRRTDGYCFDALAKRARLVFQGPDARLYLLASKPGGTI